MTEVLRIKSFLHNVCLVAVLIFAKVFRRNIKASSRLFVLYFNMMIWLTCAVKWPRLTSQVKLK